MMATIQGPATPVFRAVNAMDITLSEPPTRNMAMPRSQLTPPPPPTGAPHDARIHPSISAPSVVKVGNLPGQVSSKEILCEQEENDENTPEKNCGGTRRRSGRSPKPAVRGKSSAKVTKKKKGSKFHCTGYGPCSLSFTRSEHLARHVRKHTGERPFMCHCGRWFSRLDNLRQHSSTVHVDEDIPEDSLAASGTRYQRNNLRSERVQPRARAQSDAQPPTEQHMQSALPVLGSPMIDRRTRRRPDPIMLPQDADQDDSAFNQYRDHTPPESPVSTVSMLGGVHRQRAAPYSLVSEASSPVATPTSSRLGSVVDSPFGSPNYSPRNSFVLEGTSSIASRRLSMPVPPTPSLLNPTENRTIVLPIPSPAGYGSPPQSRRDSLTSIIADDRRRTWHMGTQLPYQSPLPRDILSPTTQSFARTTIHSPLHSPTRSPTEPNYLPNTPTRSQQTDRLPSINDVLQDCVPAASEQQRATWASDILERPPIPDLKRGFPGETSGRRVAPGQMRSSHGRSISNIETRRWGTSNSNPFSGPWGGRDRREVSLQPVAPTPLSTESNRSSGYFGGNLSNIPSPREHRQSFGSSGDSSMSEGIVTPIATMIDVSRPRILGEPGDAVFHSESPEKDYNDRSCSEMTGIENMATPSSFQTNPGPYGKRRTVFNASRLDALVSAAVVASKI